MNTTTTPAAYLTMSAFTVNEQCGRGEGSAIGLPTVPDHRVAQTVARADAWFTSHDALECVHVVCRLARSPKPGAETGDACTECGVTECNMTAAEIDDHVISGGFVLVGCEGFHTAALRAMFALGDRVNDAVAVHPNADDETDVEPDDYFDAEALVDALDEAGMGAWVLEPGPGTVQIPGATGTVFISDPDGGAVGGGYTVGVRADDGSEERVVWSGDNVDAAIAVAVATALRGSDGE